MTKPAFISCPKRKPYRDMNLRAMANGREPVAQIYEVLRIDEILAFFNEPSLANLRDYPGSTVGAHFNGYEFGKGLGSKADDLFLIFLGWNFHNWLDHSGAPKERKREVSWILYRKQLDLLERIKNDPYEPEKNRKSAGAAIEAFKDWVTENQRLFEPGDWQLNFVKGEAKGRS